MLGRIAILCESSCWRCGDAMLRLFEVVQKTLSMSRGAMRDRLRATSDGGLQHTCSLLHAPLQFQVRAFQGMRSLC
eukprot:2544022-Rhodomonas_salina.1